MNCVRKNILCYVLLLALMCLSGCAGKGAPPREEAAPPGENTEEDIIPEGTRPVRFWFAASGAGASTMEEIIRDFNASHPDYAVIPRVFGSYTEITSAIRTALTTGTAPDLVVLERDVSIDLHQKGLTVDLTELLQGDEAFDVSSFFPVYYRQGVSGDGHLFAMPLYGTTQVLYYHREAFADAGIDPAGIATWQDLADAARTIQQKGLCDYGWEPMWGYENLMDAAFSNGGTVFSEDGRTVTINAPEWVDVWETFRLWLHEERLMRIHCGGYGWEYWYHTMDDALSGTAGGYTGSSGDQADVDFDVVGMMEQPAWKEGRSAAPEAMALLLNVMSASSPDAREGACALIRYLIDVEAQVKWTTRTGYIAVNQRVLDDQSYQDYVRRNPYARIPLSQSVHASVFPVDPTGGVVRDALKLAANRVEIEGLSARDALNEAQRTAQRALDAALAEAESKAGAMNTVKTGAESAARTESITGAESAAGTGSAVPVRTDGGVRLS